MKDYFAHSANGVGQWHALSEHLAAVAKLAKSYASNWKGEEEAELAGLLHDLGKYGDRFQARLQGKDHGLDHWSQGAFLALQKAGSIATAMAIQGHHVGLQSMQKDELLKLKPESLACNHPQQLELSEVDITPLENRLAQDGLHFAKPTQRLFAVFLGRSEARIDNMLDVRRLFSALVDADFVDTEAHFNGDAQGKMYRQPGLKLNENGLCEHLLAVLQRHIQCKAAQANASAELHEVRQTLLRDCLQQAERQTGVFTLTAPTGSGKTLSMLAFALRHALKNDLERVVLVVPYLSIIEQTAGVYREIFKDFDAELILEHHSMAGLGEETAQEDAEGDEEQDRQRKRQRLLAENWDAPIVITTSVQFFESLFSNRPSTCRKIHRIANAVILFDEAQTLPTSLAIPSLAAVSHIATHWRSSVVFATATQPAFNHLHEYVAKHSSAGWQPKEIVTDHAVLADKLRRVDFYWLPEKLSWQKLAEDLQQHRQALCIVNLKRHAHALWQAFENTEALFHLSTNLCPLHRQAVIATVKQRLKDGLPCVLIATQCIEAGVDIDFPAVYRAIAPLDAIIQAAGRCNREGSPKHGQTHVFIPDDERLYPDAAYRQAADVTLSLKNELGERFDPYDPAIVERYYRRLYNVTSPEQAAKRLYEAITELRFPDVARHYRLIANDMINVVVPYDQAAFAALQTLADESGLTAAWIKRARGLSIGLYRPKDDDPVWDGLLPVQSFKRGRYVRQEDWFMVAGKEHYDNNLGYKKPDSLLCWIA